jgi:hypothetical protein
MLFKKVLFTALLILGLLLFIYGAVSWYESDALFPDKFHWSIKNTGGSILLTILGVLLSFYGVLGLLANVRR